MWSAAHKCRLISLVDFVIVSFDVLYNLTSTFRLLTLKYNLYYNSHPMPYFEHDLFSVAELQQATSCDFYL